MALPLLTPALQQWIDARAFSVPAVSMDELIADLYRSIPASARGETEEPARPRVDRVFVGQPAVHPSGGRSGLPASVCASEKAEQVRNACCDVQVPGLQRPTDRLRWVWCVRRLRSGRLGRHVYRSQEHDAVRPSAQHAVQDSPLQPAGALQKFHAQHPSPNKMQVTRNHPHKNPKRIERRTQHHPYGGAHRLKKVQIKPQTPQTQRIHCRYPQLVEVAGGAIVTRTLRETVSNVQDHRAVMGPAKL